MAHDPDPEDRREGRCLGSGEAGREQEETFIKPWMIDLADDHYPIAIDHARRKLGWEAVRRLRTTLPEMMSRMKRDPETWYRTNKLEAPKSLPKSPSR